MINNNWWGIGWVKLFFRKNKEYNNDNMMMFYYFNKGELK